MSLRLKKISSKLIYIVILAGFVSVALYFKSRYFSADNHTMLFREPKSAVITVKASKSFECFDKPNDYRLIQKGRFWVLQNYVRANRWFACDESVTLTTISDPKLLENLKTLVERWNGPVSVALYTPGTDLEVALLSIKYLRACYPLLVAEYVSFHLFFDMEHRPKNIPTKESAPSLESFLCTKPPPMQLMNGTELYRARMGLKFPINLARNIARDGATTHFILASDIELLPSRNLVSDFLSMIQQNLQYLQATTPNAFVLTPFEVEENALAPSNKKDLLAMLANGSAVTFHKHFCSYCHTVPGYKFWLESDQSGGLHVIHTSKREGFWEPFYISTNHVPYFDERLNWEGRCDRLDQAYAMCVLDYDYHLLDNAFLVHKPGIKRGKSNADIVHDKFAKQSFRIVRDEIEPDVHTLFGINEKCTRITIC